MSVKSTLSLYKKKSKSFLKDKERLKKFEKKSEERFIAFQNSKPPPPEEDVFIIARRWSSVGPAQMDIVGGGYVLFLNEIGIVIDPGYLFMKIFQRMSYNHRNINYVIITHDHYDHCSDLDAILDATRENPTPVEIYSTHLTVESQNQYLTTDKFRYEEVSYGYELDISSTDFNIIFNRAYHWEVSKGQKVIGDPIGITLIRKSVKEKILSISGDTEYHDDLINDYTDSKILIAHIGSITKSDKHLLYDGTHKLIEQVHPEFSLISEFDFKDFNSKNSRIETVQKLSKSLNTCVLASDIGFSIRLDDPYSIKCSCKKEHWATPNDINQEEKLNKKLPYYNNKNDKWETIDEFKVINRTKAC
jgi:phosphoribosyl 1,2-cyclic phosphodiesterase